MVEYQPGVCNIGKAEQRKRYGLGLGGTAVTAILSALILTDIIAPLSLVFVLLSAFAAFEGLLQGYLNFCAGFASKGLYDVSDKGEQRSEVEDETARKQDKIRALQIHLYSATGAVVTTAVVFLALNVV